MTNKELCELMFECGLQPVEEHHWVVDHYVKADSFIEGDTVALLQFAKEIIKREREACAKVCEEYDSLLYSLTGTGRSFAKAIRSRGE